MTVWDILDRFVANFPPVAAMLFLLVAGIIFAIGFFRHGVDFIKHGFKQKGISDLGAKIDGFRNELHYKIDGLRDELHSKIDGFRDELHSKIDGLDTRLTAKIHSEIGGLREELHSEIGELRFEFKSDLELIRTNHFGHIKNYLSVLNGVLLDKQIIDHESKARLDNELRGM
jgi:hypothetical protein